MPDHWITFGTFKEQDYYRYPADNEYKGIVFNANMVSHAPGGLAGFLLGKINPKSLYIIDPMTHAFQHNLGHIGNSKGEIKSSIDKLLTTYGSLVENPIRGEGRPLNPKDFEDNKRVDEFVRNVLEFQTESLTKAQKEHEYAKYLLGDDINRPYALLLPYLYFKQSTWELWKTPQEKIFQSFVQLNREGLEVERFFAAIVISADLLGEEEFTEWVADLLVQSGVEGAVLWVDDFDENSASIDYLRGLRDLVRRIRNINDDFELINLHGGYFSILISSAENRETGFTGVAHGPEFGEFRSVIPVGGGIPVAKFYLMDLHARLKYKEAVRIFSKFGWLESADVFHQSVCDCPTCREALDGDSANFVKFGISESKKIQRGGGVVTMEYPTSVTRVLCLKHYLYKKGEEFKMANELSNDQLMSMMEATIGRYQESIGLDEVGNLRQWLKAING